MSLHVRQDFGFVSIYSLIREYYWKKVKMKANRYISLLNYFWNSSVKSKQNSFFHLNETSVYGCFLTWSIFFFFFSKSTDFTRLSRDIRNDSAAYKRPEQ